MASSGAWWTESCWSRGLEGGKGRESMEGGEKGLSVGSVEVATSAYLAFELKKLVFCPVVGELKFCSGGFRSLSP